jgi:hypothetical protein
MSDDVHHLGQIAPSPRQAVYDAIEGLSDPFYLFILSVIRPVNRFVANTIVDDPTPAQKLEDAIKAEYKRFDAPLD